MSTISNTNLNHRVEQYTNSHNDKSNMTKAIKNINFLSTNLPKIDNDKKIATKTVVSKDLKTLSKQIDSVIKDAKRFLDKANANNASIRPDQNESINMKIGLNLLKEQIASYKATAFSVSTYKHNASKSTTLDNLTKKIGNMETRVICSNNKNKQLTHQPDKEKSQRMQESNERVIKRNDHQNSLNNR